MIDFFLYKRFIVIITANERLSNCLIRINKKDLFRNNELELTL